ncbi:hypothetical protein [Bacillus piscicola]|uniref:hypothetical protein n=1 Tax=Bacillus piscicola TaxID=1632684 RepID=UPI001F095FD0|nr:hypothetical protein [Bacillus piscicola]
MMGYHANQLPEILEKSMQREHGVTRVEYKESIKKKVDVEQKREVSYKKNKAISADVQSWIFK